MADEILPGLLEKTGGFPKSINGEVLFATDANGNPLFMKNHNVLFAWIDGVLKVDWSDGSDKITPTRFYLHCLQCCEKFSSVESFPHFPPLDGVYYCHPQINTNPEGRVSLPAI